ncbi:transporter [Lithospermum erythrorhizon]|uniref:Transporter n=1 Tax=Lithospermum erythrorhizon TaxID=34254 RepID=A0AAV3R998_LITER
MASIMVMENQENGGGGGGFFGRGWRWLMNLWGKITSPIKDLASDAKKLAKDDPRRVIHALKVGLAITIVSLFYYFDHLYDGFGVNAMWAVMTVVVVFEFSVGATLGRSVNRGISTLLAGGLGFGAHHLANLSGENFEPVFLGLFVFIIAGFVTFLRFIPKLKARYDYGLLIFILTFCLISVSGYRDDEVLNMAHKRLSTVLIGGSTALAICILVCPVWAGEDLHNRVANNIDKLGTFLEGFGGEYFKTSGSENKEKKAAMEGYKSVLSTKSTDETLANFAKWEPRYGRFKYRHPWDQYLKIEAHVQECAYRIDALNTHLNSELKISNEIREKLQEPCKKVSMECGMALKELASTIDSMTTTPNVDIHTANAKSTAKILKNMLKLSSWKDNDNNLDLPEIIQVAGVVSLLLEILNCTLKIGDSVSELASLAKFKKIHGIKLVIRKKSLQRTRSTDDSPHIVVNVE